MIVKVMDFLKDICEVEPGFQKKKSFWSNDYSSKSFHLDSGFLAFTWYVPTWSFSEESLVSPDLGTCFGLKYA